MNLNIGNIILYNGINYFIIDKDGEELLCVPLKDVEIKKTIYFIDAKNLDFNNTIIINSKKDLKHVANSSSETTLFVLRKYKNFLNISEIINNPQIGSIITKDNKHYYIFSEDDQKWLIFELSKNEIKNSDVFTFGNNLYYTNYFQTTINKSDTFDVIYQCHEGQIVLLKRKRRSYHKNALEKIIISNETIVKIDQLSGEEYKVKGSLGDKLVCISNYDLTQNDKTRHYFNKEDVVFVKVKYKRR